MRSANVRRAGLLWLAAVFLSAGCYKATFIDPTVGPGEEHDQWTDFFVFGIVGDEVVDVAEFCADGRAREVRTGGNFPTVLVSVLTIGIYSPRKVYVTCAAGGAAPTAEVEIDLDSTGQPVHVTRREEGRVLSGTPEALPGTHGQWRVALAEEAVR